MTKFKLYQIDVDHDDVSICFMNLKQIQKITGQEQVPSQYYMLSYEGNGAYKNLEEIYMQFNVQHPDDFRGRSMSVSDVVEVVSSDSIEKGFYFCDSYGFQKIEFIPEKTHPLNQKLRVVLVEPHRLAKITMISSSLESLQKTVGGYIEIVPFFQDGVTIVCNEEGKLNNLPLNRAIEIDDQIQDIIAGTFFLCDGSGDTLGSLSPEQCQEYVQKFKYPQKFKETEHGIEAVSYRPWEQER